MILSWKQTGTRVRMGKGLKQPSKYVNLYILCFLEPPGKVPHSFFTEIMNPF